MGQLKFNTTIDAPREKVWEILWAKDTYPKWTKAFMEGSDVETDWNEGSKVLFTDGKGSGMVSRIAKKNAPEYMSFEHLGELKDGVEDTTSDKVKQWSGSKENYILKENNGVTTLEVELDMGSDMQDYFIKTFPKALQLVKELSEE